MSRVDIVFLLLGLFSYFSITHQFREQRRKLERYAMVQEKRAQYENFMKEQRHREAMQKAAKERRERSKEQFNTMASAAELLSNISDQEIMRKSRVTSGKVI